MRKRTKELQNSQKKNLKNGNSQSLPIYNDFKCKWIKFSSQKIRTTECMKNKTKTQPYAAHKTLTSAVRTPTGWKWREAKEYSMQITVKREQW